MNSPSPLSRSPELLTRADSALLVVDVQEKLLPLIHDQQRILWNIARLLDGARILEVPAAGTEQYPKGLGPTVGELAKRIQGPLSQKQAFSCGACPEIFQAWHERGIYKIVLAGIEAHVCVLQTALDLLADGFRVHAVADAVGSRQNLDRDTALRRMDSAGAVLTTTETVLFEWCEVAGTTEFKEISQLVRQSAPA